MVDMSDKSKKKGFSGIESLATDIDNNQPTTKHDIESSPADVQDKSSIPTKEPKPARPQVRPQTNTSKSSGNSDGSNYGWFWVIAFFILMGLIFGGDNNDKKSSSNNRSYSSPGVPSSTKPYSPSIQGSNQTSSLSTSKPPTGRNHTLNERQIAYCLAEKIRLDAAEGAINSNSDSDINRFNAMINDYNSRCGEYRYYQGALSRAKRDVEKHRPQLVKEGKARFVKQRTSYNSDLKLLQEKLKYLGYDVGAVDGVMGKKTKSAITEYINENGRQTNSVALDMINHIKRVWPSVPLPRVSGASSQPVPKPYTRKNVNQELKLLQEKLNYLGYNAGTPDGIMGRKTRSAIEKFMKEHGHQTDEAAQKIIKKIKRVMPSGIYTPKPRTTGSNTTGVPANSFAIGNKWYCKDGYRKSANKCVSINPPANSFAIGDKWHCKDGYRKSANKCVSTNPPANSFAIGDKWYCKDGYRKSANKCVNIYTQ